MKLYVRVMLAAGAVEYGGFVLLCTLGWLLHPLFYGMGGAWLLVSRRPVKRHVLPFLFPTTRCTCQTVISLTSRWSRGEEWTDSKERHALRVYSPKQYEIGSFTCPICDATIELQKASGKRLANWKIVDADAIAANLPKQGDISLGTVRGSLPSRFGRAVRSRLQLPSGTPVYTSYAMMAKHMFVIGKTGQGKSVLLTSVIKQLMEDGQGVTVFDPDGDLVEELKKHVPKHRLEDVVYFNIQDTENPPPFNILHEADVNDRNALPGEVMGLFAKLYASSWGDNIARILRLALNAALEINGSLEDVYDLLANSDRRYRIARRLKDDKLREFWESGILNPKLQAAKYSLINKLEEVVHHPYVGPIVRSKSCLFDADEVIAGGKILLVNLNTGTEPGDTLRILGTMITKKMTNAAYRQSRFHRADRRQHFMVIDEFADFISSSFDWNKGLSKLRKYGFSFESTQDYFDATPRYANGLSGLT